MPSRSNTEDQIPTYGSPMGPEQSVAAPDRRKAAPAPRAALQKAIAADVTASRQPVKTAPVAPAQAPKKTNAFSVFRAADDIRARKNLGSDVE